MLECWNVGMLECWNVGKLENWKIGMKPRAKSKGEILENLSGTQNVAEGWNVGLLK